MSFIKFYFHQPIPHIKIFPLKKGENGSNIESLVQTILKFNQENSISFKAWE